MRGSLHAVEDVELTAEWAEKARALAEQLGDDEPLLYALGNMAQLAMLASRAGRSAASRRDLRARTTARARRARGPHFRHARSGGHHGAVGIERQTSTSRRGSSTASHAASILWRFYLLAYRARSLLDRGRWDEARRDSASSSSATSAARRCLRIVALSCSVSYARGAAIRTCGRSSTRPGGSRRSTGELQRIEPAVAARGRGGVARGAARPRRQRTSRPLSSSLY